MTAPVVKQVALLVFVVGEQRWAVSADTVREIHESLTVQPIPGTAIWFLGTALVRGRVLAVSDFGAWLGTPGPVNRFVEFEQGYVLAVSHVHAVAQGAHPPAEQLDPARLVAMPEFLDVTSAGASLKVAESL